MKYLYIFCCIALLLPLYAQESLIETINKYYENLDQQAELAAKKGDVQNAYENFSRIPTLEEFLQYNSILTGQEELEKIRKQNKGRLGCVYIITMLRLGFLL